MYNTFIKNLSSDLDKFFEVVPSNTDVFSKSYARSNVYVDDRKLLGEILVAGIDTESIEISVQENTITISGKQKKDKSIEHENMPRIIKEIHLSDLEHKIRVPFKFDEEKVKAELENGILSVRVERTLPQEAKKIPLTFVN